MVTNTQGYFSQMETPQLAPVYSRKVCYFSQCINTNQRYRLSCFHYINQRYLLSLICSICNHKSAVSIITNRNHHTEKNKIVFWIGLMPIAGFPSVKKILDQLWQLVLFYCGRFVGLHSFSIRREKRPIWGKWYRFIRHSNCLNWLPLAVGLSRSIYLEWCINQQSQYFPRFVFKIFSIYCDCHL